MRLDPPPAVWIVAESSLLALALATWLWAFSSLNRHGPHIVDTTTMSHAATAPPLPAVSQEPPRSSASWNALWAMERPVREATVTPPVALVTKPLPIELLGLAARSGGVPHAYFYDIRTDDTLAMVQGETRGDLYLKSIGSRSVEIEIGGAAHELTLTEGPE